MINEEKFLIELINEGTDFFTGVPDSYLNGFCNCLLKHSNECENVIAANEGNAIGIAAGHYFSTKSIPLVYMQNSGLGNAINPLASLADENVYAIPMILLIGWRGQPDSNDWVQHKLQGEMTLNQLEIMNIPYRIIQDNDKNIAETVKWASSEARSKRKPVALVAPKGVLSGSKGNNKETNYPLSREEAIEIILDAMPNDTIYSATTGRATRELYFLREKRNEEHGFDFLNVGSMGHASSVALGIAMGKPLRNVVCLDGDAAAIMHLGAMTMVSKLEIPNFIHIILNNGAHESVGGQPSVGQLINFTSIARAAGYQTVEEAVTNREELTEAINWLKGCKKASFIDIRIHKGLKSTLPSLEICHGELAEKLMMELNK